MSRALAVLALCLVVNAHAGTVLISDARIHASPPTIRVLAGYMHIKNVSASEQTITGMASTQFQSVEIHKTEIRDDVARMLKQESLTLQAGEEVLLEPGGMHLMFINPAANLKSGDQVDLTLTLHNGETIPLTIDVINPGSAHRHEHH